ncbi:MAG: YbaK/EbsC family protein [Clostridia bacterium]|nr:YbaK/EbsC family protein [Clostridia bacterium]
MSIEKVKAFFAGKDMADKVLEFDVSSATVELAAIALGCEECRIAKTLSFHVNDKVVLVVTAGDVKIDNQKYKAVFGTKAKMLAHEEAPVLIGHAVGGVCPFAVNEGVEVWLDVSLQRFETVFPACGSASSAIELTPAQLEELSVSLGWIDVTKPR